MAGYKCKKCGTTASSKCVRSRHVFPSSRWEGVLSNILKYKVKDMDSDPNVQEVTLTLCWQDKKTDTEHLQTLFKIIRELDQEDLDIYACGDHKWELLDDECDLGCCKKGE